MRAHIGREGGRHYSNYRELCERNGIKPDERCAPTTSLVGTESAQSSLDPFLVPLAKPTTLTWSREGLLSHLCELVVSDDQVSQDYFQSYENDNYLPQAFELVEKPSFRALLQYQRPTMVPRDIPHAQTVADEIYAKALRVKGLLREKFRNLDSAISFTFDAGTSQASDPYLTVTGHWIDKTWTLHEQILAFSLIEGSHTGANTGQLLIDTFEDYGILSPSKVCVTLSY